MGRDASSAPLLRPVQRDNVRDSSAGPLKADEKHVQSVQEGPGPQSQTGSQSHGNGPGTNGRRDGSEAGEGESRPEIQDRIEISRSDTRSVVSWPETAGEDLEGNTSVDCDGPVAGANAPGRVVRMV